MSHLKVNIDVQTFMQQAIVFLLIATFEPILLEHVQNIIERCSIAHDSFLQKHRDRRKENGCMFFFNFFQT